ncbi:MAG: sodium:solute symporter family protein [Balneolaceae bacterium]|nr:MAG: sodium:solute symporter family protein [Balneolaceae bacterium]
MHPIDFSLFIIYIIALLAFGYFFFRRNKSGEDFYVGGRNMKSYHVGLSVVATDVGGGFSIGLGGLGFVIGLSGSWMLFTGLLGAWLAAVFLIPKIKRNSFFDDALTFPQLFEHYYNGRVAFVAAIISAIGYTGFTSSQLLAGAKLASGTFVGLEHHTALIIMGSVAVLYTVLGGLKAVIYTDTIQWALLMTGLLFVGVPIAYFEIGGLAAIRETVDPEMLTLTNVLWQDIVFWMVTIIPIWFVGMTLYQRIYACKDEKTAKKAWYIAGLFEWPVMAFLGVLLGLFARVAADQGMFEFLGAADATETDPETGLPMLLRTVLPVGFLGIMMAAYFSAILSTADSCLMASSGNVVSDIIGKFKKIDGDSRVFIRISQVITLVIGILALLLAAGMTNVLDLMLDSYAFMVSGLFIPVMGALFWKKSTPAGALTAMIVGGSVTIILRYAGLELPYSLDPNVFGMSMSAISFITVSLITFKQETIK